MIDFGQELLGLLTAEQQKFLPHLISSSTLREAAKSSGISEATVYRWLRQPNFKEAYRIARLEALQITVARLQSASASAVDTLLDVSISQTVPASARVAASKAILEYALKATETEELLTRIEKLEEAIEEAYADAV